MPSAARLVGKSLGAAREVAAGGGGMGVWVVVCVHGHRGAPFPAPPRPLTGVGSQNTHPLLPQSVSVPASEASPPEQAPL